MSTRFIAENLKVRLSASEMLLIAQILPFLIKDKVPDSDEEYQCFLKLIEIVQIAYSPTASDDVNCFVPLCNNRGVSYSIYYTLSQCKLYS